MPPAGTYAYAHGFSGDSLRVGDASLPTEPFKQPFFATVRHEGSTCFTFTAYLANGPNGRHDHAWRFCNRCEGDAGTSLDLMDEKDYFATAAAPGAQVSAYTCGSPNAYISATAIVDASVALAPCTGKSEGALTTTIQSTSLSHVYRGRLERGYADPDASATCEVYEGTRRVQLAGGGAPVTNTSNWAFMADGGAPFQAVVIADTTTTLGGLPVTHRFSLAFFRKSPTVSPLLPSDDAGL